MTEQKAELKAKVLNVVLDKFQKQTDNRIKNYFEKSRKVDLFFSKGIVEKKHPAIIKEIDNTTQRIEIIEKKNVSIDNQAQHKKVAETLQNTDVKYQYKTFMFNKANATLRKEEKAQQ